MSSRTNSPSNDTDTAAHPVAAALFVGNGYLRNGPLPGQLLPNRVFRNVDGERFEETAAAWGLDDRLHTHTSVVVDLDNDGDLDIVGTGPLTVPRIWWNESTENNSITVVLADEGQRISGPLAAALRATGREVQVIGAEQTADQTDRRDQQDEDQPQQDVADAGAEPATEAGERPIDRLARRS